MAEKQKGGSVRETSFLGRTYSVDVLAPPPPTVTLPEHNILNSE